MKTVLLLLFITIFSWTTVQAEIYSCRDKRGKLYMTDNIQTLPAECQGRTQVVESRKSDNLNIVSSQDTPQGSGPEFDQAVRDADQDLKEKQALREGFLNQAQQLAAQYQQAVEDRNSATQRWKYAGSRDAIRRADEQISQVQEAKQQLLDEISGQNLPRSLEQEIINQLNTIGE